MNAMRYFVYGLCVWGVCSAYGKRRENCFDTIDGVYLSTCSMADRNTVSYCVYLLSIANGDNDVADDDSHLHSYYIVWLYINRPSTQFKHLHRLLFDLARNTHFTTYDLLC